VRKCNVCNEKHYSKGYCSRHYQQMYKHGKILERTVYDPNEIIIRGGFAEIILYNQKNQEVARTIIDSEDVEKVKNHKWCLHKGYAVTSIQDKLIGLPYIIMGIRTDKKQRIDHKNRHPLNNRKSNFRFCTHTENMMNRPKQKNNTSGFKGVDRVGERWRAKIKINQKLIHLGTFISKNEAARAYNKAATKHFGEFACLNRFK